MKQLSLFDRPAPCQPYSSTSKAGADYIADRGRVKGVKRLVLAALELAGPEGATIEQITATINKTYERKVKETTVAARLAGKNELFEFAAKSGKTRTNTSGTPANIFVLRKWMKLDTKRKEQS